MTEQPTWSGPAPEPSYDETTARPVKVAHLVVGLIFLGIAGLWALDAAGLADGADARYFAPGVLVAAGVAGLIALLASTRRGDRR